MPDLQSASREELLAMIETLLARVAELEEEVRRLRAGHGGSSALAVKPNRPAREQKERKHRGRAFVRRREVQPDEVRTHAVESCPECGRALTGGWEQSRRQVIEIICRSWVTEHVLVRRRCGVCQKEWVPPVAPQEYGVQGKRRFGVSLQSFVATLHIGCRLPLRMIGKLLHETCGVHVSNGEMVKLLDGVKQAGELELAALKERVRHAPAVCGDETGWRQDGENGYLWGFFTEQERYFEYRQSRASTVPEEILGESFGGVVTCDFYAGYNKLGRLQRCWPHLLRDAQELAEVNADRPAVVAWVQALKGLYHEAKACAIALGALPPEARPRQRERRRFEQLAARLAKPYAHDPEAPQRVLAQRILKHLHELFVFLADPRVPGDNNLAERSLRPAVIARKVSGGTRSAKGSATRMGLMSLLGTWAAQGKSQLQGCRELLLPTPAP